MGKILVSYSHFDTLCKPAWKLLEDNGHEIIFDPDRLFPAYRFEELQHILPDVDAVFTALDDFNAEVFKLSKKLKCVCKSGVGVDNIDIDAATRHGVMVCNCPGQNSNAVAELTVAFMIMLLRGLLLQDQAVRRSEWPRYLGGEVKHKVIGLIGFGSIARMVAQKLQAFDVKILATDLFPNKTLAQQMGVSLVTQDDIIEQSDIISLHIPASRQNYHMFDRRTFSRMKKGAYLINTARGSLVDLEDLADSLLSGQLAGAALDAFETEPLPAGTKIFQCRNVVLTPHTGADTLEAYNQVSLLGAKNIIDALNGKIPECCLNRQALQNQP